MLADELKEKLKNTEPDIEVIQKFYKNSGIEEEFQRLRGLSQQEDFWQFKDQASILKSLQRVKTIREQYHTILQQYAEFDELVSLFEQDEQELINIKKDIDKLIKSIRQFKVNLLLSDVQDDSSCFLSINAGAGGTEAQDWAEMLLRMYIRFCEREKLGTQLVDYQPGEGAGIKSATLYVTGNKAYGLLKNEQGIHRLVRISPYDASKRRHTSFAAVTAVPEMLDVAITIDPNDLRIDTYRASGAGGQHVNKTESAVRITHIPTNIVVQCQNERSQTQNRETAMKMLKAKLLQKEQEEQKAKLGKQEKKKIEWGSQIRSYVLHPYKMVKDHRTDIESSQPDLVLDGDIMEFIEANLIKTGTQH